MKESLAYDHASSGTATPERLDGMTAAPSTDDRRYVLSLGCPDTTGIVARISSFLTDVGGWIVEAAYHADADTGWFFTRQAVRASSVSISIEELRDRFEAVAAEIGPETEWTLHDSGLPRRSCFS